MTVMRKSKYHGEHALNLNEMELGSGVYFLYNKDELVYIGKAANITRRIIEHIDEGVKKFDKVRYSKVPVDSLNFVESTLINELKPKYNSFIGIHKSENERESISKSRVSIALVPGRVNRFGEYPVLIRVTYKRNSFYIKTNMMAYEEDKEGSRIINPQIIRDGKKLMKPLNNAVKFISSNATYDYVKKKLMKINI